MNYTYLEMHTMEDVLFFIALAIIYGVLQIFSSKVFFSQRPQASFLRMTLAYMVGPLLLLVYGVGRILLYSGACVSTFTDIAVNRLVPVRRTGAFENRPDLH